MGYGSVGSAQLLLGILADQESPAARLLDRHGVTLSPAREAVARILADAQDARAPAKTTYLTPHATSVMHRASVEARRRGAPDLGPMHVLVALIDSPDAVEVFGLSATDLATLRADALAELDA